MKRLKLLLVVVSAIAMFVGGSGTASAGAFTLHPSGFGEHSYAAWKPYQGQADSNGNKSQALYFQKFTTTATVAAGVVLIKGVEGMDASELTGLAWDHREDGHCGAGAPRWNIGISTAMGDQTIFLGCNAADHSEAAVASGHGWCTDTQTVPTFTPGTATIRYLAIVFDEGTDNPNPPPAGCAQEQIVPSGFVYLDNITVEINGEPHVWTSASDNGNGGTTTANTTLTSDQLQQQLGFPLQNLLQ
jgi:hypothetical protein